MSTATPPDFEAYNDIFTSLIDSIIPAGFGVSKNGSSSNTPVETADEIVERNKALRKAERHRKIISNGTAPPSSSTSSLISASNIPLANALKRRAPDGTEPKSTPTANGVPSPTEDHDDDDDEEESRTRVVSKKNKLSRDVFSTKKQNAKVKTKLNGVAGVKEPKSNGVAGVKGKEQDDEGTPTPPPKQPETASISSYNPFKLPTDSSSTQTFSSPLPGMQTIFSSQPSPPKPLAPQVAAPPSLPPSSPRQRTGMTPPPELHGKERKRWRKKMKKANASASANTAEPET